MVSSIQLGIASLSSLVFIALLGMGTDFLIHKMENTLIACQHDTVSINVVVIVPIQVFLTASFVKIVYVKTMVFV